MFGSALGEFHIHHRQKNETTAPEVVGQILEEFEILAFVRVGSNDIVQTNPGIKFLSEFGRPAIGDLEGCMREPAVSSLLASGGDKSVDIVDTGSIDATRCQLQDVPS